MNKIAIAAIVLLLILAGAYVAFLTPEGDQLTSSAPTSTPNVASTTPEEKTNEAAGLKTYTNTKYHYSFSYPREWILDPESSVIDANNNMPSIISVHEAKGDQPRRFSITMNLVERTIKNKAPKTETVTIDGSSATAYIFPNGYECDETGDCSFFLVPVLHSGLWYELTAANDAKTLDFYRSILASFKFTK